MQEENKDSQSHEGSFLSCALGLIQSDEFLLHVLLLLITVEVESLYAATEMQFMPNFQSKTRYTECSIVRGNID